MSLPTSNPVVYTPDQWAVRLINTQPAQWFSDEAKAPGGVLYSLMYAIGQVLQTLQLGLQYSYDSVYLQMAVGSALDMAAQDFYGETVLRLPGESDAAFSSRIMAGLFSPVATYEAVYNAVQQVSGIQVQIIQPWDIATTGTLDAQFFDVPDGAIGGLRLTPNRPYECLIIATPPGAAALNGNPLYTLDSGFFDSPTFFSADVVSSGGVQALFEAINKVAPLGVGIWVQVGYNSV